MPDFTLTKLQFSSIKRFVVWTFSAYEYKILNSCGRCLTCLEKLERVLL